MTYEVGFNRTGGVTYTQWLIMRRGGWRWGHDHSGCVPREGCDLNDPEVDCCDSLPLVPNTTEPTGGLPPLEPLPEVPEVEPVPVVPAPTIYGTHSDPQYSYVYTYTPKSGGGGHGNITYPEYDIKTTHYEGEENYTEGEGENCPCDLGDWESGEAEINDLVEKVAESVSEQQQILDEAYFKELGLADPESYEDIVPKSTSLVGDEVDKIHSYNFLDGT